MSDISNMYGIARQNNHSHQKGHPYRSIEDNGANTG